MQFCTQCLPPTNEVCDGYVFTCVCHSVHRVGVVSQHALQVVSQHALQVSRGVYPSMPCRFPGPHPGRSLRGLAGVSPGSHLRVSPGPHLGGLQAHTLVGVSRPTSGVVYPRMHWGRPPTADGYCCGWYTSYWNAFLSTIIISQRWGPFCLQNCFCCTNARHSKFYKKPAIDNFW